MTDKETTEDKAKRALPASVERALARARDAAKADAARKSGRWLVVIPLSIGAILLLFMMPRSTPPDGVPLPRVDRRVTTAIAKAEDALAASTVAERLPGDILAVGSALRELNAVDPSDPNQGIDARRKLDQALTEASGLPNVEQNLIKLRAAQTRTFLDAVASWEQGAEPKEFIESGGGFVTRAQQVGWVQGRKVLLDDTQRRVAFKTVWNALTHLDRGVFSITLDEERALYAFYIQHPRPPENNRLTLEQSRRDAKTPDACIRAQADQRRQEELWRADKIKRLAAIDPTYPASYALGVVYHQSGRTDLAVEAFTAFIDAHPDGPYTLRARNHLKAALTGTAP